MALLPALLLLAQPPSVAATAQQIIDENRAPGVVVYVRHQGKERTALALGYADLEKKTPMRLDSLHELASVSKPFTAVTVMRLVDQGRLSLDSKLSDFVPDAPEAWKGITTRHLLQHTSGLPDYLGPLVNLSKETSAETLLLNLRSRPLRFEPGSKFEYSNSGYLALGVMVEKAAQRPFPDVALREVIRPAGMRGAQIAHPKLKARHVAKGYQRKSGQWVSEETVSAGYSALGDGFLMASARDMIAWHQTLRRQRILKPDSWAFLLTPSPQSPKGMPYGGGFIVQEQGSRVGHNGAWIGTTTYWMSDLKTDTCIVVFANGDNARIGPIITRINQELKL